MRQNILLICFLLSLFSVRAWAGADGIDALSGVRISVASLQSILAVPPLPNLEGSDHFALSLQGGASTGSVSQDGSYVGPPASTQWHDQGSFQGWTGSLGVTSKTWGGLSFFALYSQGKMSGDINTDATHTSLKNIQTNSNAALGALSFRFLGDDKSTVAAGVFVGPVWMSFDSSFHFEETSPKFISSSNYTSSPTVSGYLAGLQLKLRLGDLKIAPYGLYFGETSNRCKAFYSPNANDVFAACEGDDRKADVSASFSAFGLNLGWKKLSLNVFSQVQNDSSMSFIKINNYQLSYSIEL